MSGDLLWKNSSNYTSPKSSCFTFITRALSVDYGYQSHDMTAQKHKSRLITHIGAAQNLLHVSSDLSMTSDSLTRFETYVGQGLCPALLSVLSLTNSCTSFMLWRKKEAIVSMRSDQFESVYQCCEANDVPMSKPPHPRIQIPSHGSSQHDVVTRTMVEIKPSEE
jgi:hypothetical protein